MVRTGILSNKEREIMELTCQGLTSGQIARAIKRSIYTVNGHLRSIFLKLDATSKAQAVYIYLKST